MKTLTLINVPKTHPSRKEKLDAFKLKHGIETHTAGWDRKDFPWCACLMPKAKEIAGPYMRGDKPDLFNLVAHAGRLLEEAGVLVTGETERMAVGTLCEENGIPFEL